MESLYNNGVMQSADGIGQNKWVIIVCLDLNYMH